MYKTAFVICAVALIQSISAQWVGAYNGLGVPYGIGDCGEAWGPYGARLGPAALAASNGGGLAVTSISAIAPTGVSVISDNAYEGALAITGAIPFLGAVALDGAVPTAGAGAVTYACGNGNVAVLAEDFRPFGCDGLVGPYGYNGFMGPYGYDGLAGPYGYNGIFGPYGYNGFLRPYGCDGFMGANGIDGFMGPAYGLYGYGGLYY